MGFTEVLMLKRNAVPEVPPTLLPTKGEPSQQLHLLPACLLHVV